MDNFWDAMAPILFDEKTGVFSTLLLAAVSTIFSGRSIIVRTIATKFAKVVVEGVAMYFLTDVDKAYSGGLSEEIAYKAKMKATKEVKAKVNDTTILKHVTSERMIDDAIERAVDIRNKKLKRGGTKGGRH